MAPDAARSELGREGGRKERRSLSLGIITEAEIVPVMAAKAGVDTL